MEAELPPVIPEAQPKANGDAFATNGAASSSEIPAAKKLIIPITLFKTQDISDAFVGTVQEATTSFVVPASFSGPQEAGTTTKAIPQYEDDDEDAPEYLNQARSSPGSPFAADVGDFDESQYAALPEGKGKAEESDGMGVNTMLPHTVAAGSAALKKKDRSGGEASGYIPAKKVGARRRDLASKRRKRPHEQSTPAARHATHSRSRPKKTKKKASYSSSSSSSSTESDDSGDDEADSSSDDSRGSDSGNGSSSSSSDDDSDKFFEEYHQGEDEEDEDESVPDDSDEKHKVNRVSKRSRRYARRKRARGRDFDDKNEGHASDDHGSHAASPANDSDIFREVIKKHLPEMVKWYGLQARHFTTGEVWTEVRDDLRARGIYFSTISCVNRWRLLGDPSLGDWTTEEDNLIKQRYSECKSPSYVLACIQHELGRFRKYSNVVARLHTLFPSQSSTTPPPRPPWKRPKIRELGQLLTDSSKLRQFVSPAKAARYKQQQKSQQKLKQQKQQSRETSSRERSTWSTGGKGGASRKVDGSNEQKTSETVKQVEEKLGKSRAELEEVHAQYSKEFQSIFQRILQLEEGAGEVYLQQKRIAQLVASLKEENAWVRNLIRSEMQKMGGKGNGRQQSQQKEDSSDAEGMQFTL